jgi:hypothetical protein
MRLEKVGTPLNLQANDGDEQRKEEPIEFDVFENYDTLQRRGSQRSIFVTVALSRRSLDVNGEGEQSLWDRTESGGGPVAFLGSAEHIIYCRAEWKVLNLRFSDLMGPC